MCLAVGDRARGIGTDQPLAERWDGNRWRVIAAPAVAGKNVVSYLETLSCAAPTRCLAIGGADNIHTNVLSAFAEQWNGARWRILAVRFPRGSVLRGVSCVRNTCMIVGDSGSGAPIAMQVVSARLLVRRPVLPTGGRRGQLLDVSCTKPSSCMAVGAWFWGRGTGLLNASALAEAWNGNGWHLRPVPHPTHPDTTLDAVSCSSAGHCLAVGFPVAGAAPFADLAALWNSGRWHRLTIEGHHSQGFATNAVSCPSATSCVTVGYSLVNDHPGALRWNGRSLTFLPVARPAAGHLYAVSCTKPAHCIAVGGSAEPGATTHNGALAELWTGNRWQLLPITG